MKPFSPPFERLYPARFLQRPNRFLVQCEVDGAGTVQAFLPNPGRLWELLLPEVRLWLTPSAPSGTRKTQYTVVAVEREGAPVFLHTHATNAVARRLLESRLAPGLEGARIVRAEVKEGRNRFDFLLEDHAGEILLEVKSCTLFGNRVAMFPDAITERGRRHLLELDALAQSGRRTAVLFVVHSARVDWFMPGYHTDLEFSRTLLDVRHHVPILPVSIRWRPDLTLEPTARLLEIPWTFLEHEVEDRGAFLIVMRVTEGCEAQGVEGPGYCIYTGWAENNLMRRVRNFPKGQAGPKDPPHRLAAQASGITPLPIVSSSPLEPALGRALRRLYGAPKFRDEKGALFFAGHNPLDSGAFHRFLQRFRMRRPG